MQIIQTSDPQAIPLALATLSRGELVIYPTETCYGIAVDGTNSEAVARLLTYKGDRHRQVSIAVAVDSRPMAEQYVKINSIADNLLQNFSPAPLPSFPSPYTVSIPDSNRWGNWVFVSQNMTLLSLLLYNLANRSPPPAPTRAAKGTLFALRLAKISTTDKQSMVSLFLDAGKLADRPTSTVVDTTLNDPQILRQGALVIPTLAPSFTSSSVKETFTIAHTILTKHLSLTRRFPLILALQGDLGVGKTQFVKGVAATLGIDLNISSPTYTLMKEYTYGSQGSDLKGSAQPADSKAGRSDPKVVSKYSGVLYHIDTWRLSDPTELESTLHLHNLLKPGNIVAIEWAGKAESLLKSYEKDVPILVINITELDVNTRQITYAFSTPEWS
jgi:L-threonylcarbamoyladenylate synthase